jgi:hypothetical protein
MVTFLLSCYLSPLQILNVVLLVHCAPHPPTLPIFRAVFLFSFRYLHSLFCEQLLPFELILASMRGNSSYPYQGKQEISMNTLSLPHMGQTLIPNCEDFSRLYCLNDRWSFHSVSYLSTDISWLGTNSFWKFLCTCKITGTVLEYFNGLCYECCLSLSLKGRNLYIYFICFLIMTSPKPSVNRNLFVGKYNQDVGI